MSSEQSVVIRFRVPREIWEIAEQRSQHLGIPAQPGQAGGVSELARRAFYSALALPLPTPAHELQSKKLKGSKNLFHPSRKFKLELGDGQFYEILPDIPNEKFRRVRVYHQAAGVEHEFQLSDVFLGVYDVGHDEESIEQFIHARREELLQLLERHPYPAVFLYQSDSPDARLSERLSEEFKKELEHIERLNARSR